MHVTGVEVLSDTIEGQGGFLAIRRLRLVNVRADGTRDGPRPPLALGRPAEKLVVPDRGRYLFFREITVDPAQIVLLGAGT